MGNCKFFYTIIYLITRCVNYTISTYQKGVMATRFGAGERYKNFSKKIQNLKEEKRKRLRKRFKQLSQKITNHYQKRGEIYPMLQESS